MDMSLRQRVEAFNRRWPRNKITVYRLRKLYYEHRIKQRVLRVDIQLTDRQLRGQREGRLLAFPRIIKAVDTKEELLFMDEAVFSTNQVSPKIWFTPQHEPVLIKRKKLGFKAIAVAAAINMDGEVVAVHVVDKAID